VAIAAAIWTALYLIAGIRWYFAFIILIGLSVFAVLVAIRATSRKPIAIACCLLLVVAVSRAFVFGSGPYLPPSISRLLTFSRTQSSTESFSMVQSVESARVGFEGSGGATQIVTPSDREARNRAAAADVTQDKASPTAPKNHTAVAPAQPPRIAAAEVRVEPAAASEHGDRSTSAVRTSKTEATVSATETAEPVSATLPRRAISKISLAPAPTIGPPDPAVHPPASHDRSRTAESSTPAVALHVTPNVAAQSPPVSVAEARIKTTSPEMPTNMENAPPQSQAHEPLAEKHSSRGVLPAVEKKLTPKKKRHSLKATTPTAATDPAPALDRSIPATSPPPAVAPQQISRPAVQRSFDDHSLKLRAERLAAGAGAMVLPRSIGQWIGLYEIGGGKNFWWFSDVDTIVFDAVLVFAFVWLLRSRRSVSLKSPTFWFVAGVTLFVSVPLAYAVTNFGTLFRLREMTYIGLFLIPLALATAQKPALAAAAAGDETDGIEDPAESGGTACE
jgi:hypothetical protein